MSTDADKKAWMKEHLRYEITMMRSAFRETVALAPRVKVDATLQYAYNVAYEAFILHARNLSDFLQNSGGPTNYKANDFVPKFKTKNYKKSMEGPMDALHRQVFHMAKNRPAGGVTKFDTTKCVQVNSWLEAQLSDFRAALREPFLTTWQTIEPSLPHLVFEVPQNRRPAQSSFSHSISVTSTASGNLTRK